MTIRQMAIEAWTATAAALRAEGAAVQAYCARCSTFTPVDLEHTIARHGELFSFWDRHPPCRGKCGGKVTFVAKRLRVAGVSPMAAEGLNLSWDLHRAWRAERAAVVRDRDARAWLQARRRERTAVRREARKLITHYGERAVESAALELRFPGMTDAQLAQAAAVYREVGRRLQSTS